MRSARVKIDIVSGSGDMPADKIVDCVDSVRRTLGSSEGLYITFLRIRVSKPPEEASGDSDR